MSSKSDNDSHLSANDQLMTFHLSPPSAQDLALLPFLSDDQNDQLSSSESSSDSDSDGDSHRECGTSEGQANPKFPLKLKAGRTRKRKNVGIEELAGDR